MSGEAAPVVKVSVLGARELLYFETDEPIAPSANLRFSAAYTSADGKDSRSLQWNEDGVAVEPVPADEEPLPAAGVFRYRVPWTVNLGGDAAAAQARCQLNYLILSTGNSGATIVATARDTIFVDRLRITTRPELTRIMLHEFNRPEEIPSSRTGPDDYEFAPAPLQRYLDGLSVNQKKLLLNYDVAAHDGNRLVVFATFVKNPVNMMGADFCTDWATSAIANANFAVFHCRGNTQGVELLCYTEHFLMNFNYWPAKAMVTSKNAGRPASEWTHKDTPTPVMFKFSCATPAAGEEGTHWSIYNRIFNPKTGVDEMKGNTMHGMINTKGCWMLFRNYNWYREKFQQFSDIYTDLLRTDASIAQVEGELAKHGYNVHKATPRIPDADGLDTSAMSNSLHKFAYYDFNFAFQWFFHEIVGVKYFSRNDKWNERNVHGRALENTFPLDEGGRRPPYNDADEGDYSSYYIDDRWAEDHKAKRPALKIDADRFRKNVLGFQPASAFVPLGSASISKALLASSSWADLYIYSEEGVVLDRSSVNPPRRPSTITPLKKH